MARRGAIYGKFVHRFLGEWASDFLPFGRNKRAVVKIDLKAHNVPVSNI